MGMEREGKMEKRTRWLALAAAVVVAVAACWLAHVCSPTVRLRKRTLELASTVELQRQALTPLETVRRLSAAEGALAADASAEFDWRDGGSWTVEGRREIKDLHAMLLSEAPRSRLALEGLTASARRTGPDAVDTFARARLRFEGELPLDDALHATCHWNKTRDGWKIRRLEFRLGERPPQDAIASPER